MKTFLRFFSAFVLLLAAWSARAGELPFSQQLFDELRAAGKPVAVHIHALWCGTCKAQSRLLAPLLEEPQFKNLVVLKADFDREKSLLRELNVAAQSTFVVFKDGREAGRSTGDTDRERIAGLLRKAL